MIVHQSYDFEFIDKCIPLTYRIDHVCCDTVYLYDQLTKSAIYMLKKKGYIYAGLNLKNFYMNYYTGEVETFSRSNIQLVNSSLSSIMYQSPVINVLETDDITQSETDSTTYFFESCGPKNSITLNMVKLSCDYTVSISPGTANLIFGWKRYGTYYPTPAIFGYQASVSELTGSLVNQPFWSETDDDKYYDLCLLGHAWNFSTGGSHTLTLHVSNIHFTDCKGNEIETGHRCITRTLRPYPFSTISFFDEPIT